MLKFHVNRFKHYINHCRKKKNYHQVEDIHHQIQLPSNNAFIIDNKIQLPSLLTTKGLIVSLQWDILSNNGVIKEMFYIAKGPDPGNSVSLLRVNVSNKLLLPCFILQRRVKQSAKSFIFLMHMLCAQDFLKQFQQQLKVK